jgi:hypothetical protein
MMPGGFYADTETPPALLQLQERVGRLEAMLLDPPRSISGHTAPGPNTGLVDAGVVLQAGWTFGTNYVVKQGFYAHVYFNLTNTAGIAADTDGDIANLTAAFLPEVLRPVINANIGHAITGEPLVSLTFTDTGGLGFGGIVVPALMPGRAWPAGQARSFGGSYMTRSFGWTVAS